MMMVCRWYKMLWMIEKRAYNRVDVFASFILPMRNRDRACVLDESLMLYVVRMVVENVFLFAETVVLFMVRLLRNDQVKHV